MSAGPPISRRRLGQWMAALLPGSPQLARGQTLDQGIGGTGAVGDSKDEPSDQMIGGTGVVGTIRRFGSIYVNGLRIAYPDDLVVTQDDARLGTRDLKLGQVVRVGAAPEKGKLVARSIRVLHEVVGPLTSINTGSLTVLGQTVSLDNKPDLPPMQVGQPIAVSGLRRLDGTIVASRVDAVPAGRLRIAGPLVISEHGEPMIGALPVAKVDPAFVGRRVYLAGQLTGARFVVSAAVTERDALARLGTPRLSLEAYVAQNAGGLHLGSGLHVEGVLATSVSEELAVVTVALKNRDQLVAEKVEVAPSAAPTTAPARDENRQARDRKAPAGTEGRGQNPARGSDGRGGGRGRR